MEFIIKMKYFALFIAVCLGVLFISMTSASLNLVYDDFNDASLNNTLWLNTTLGTATGLRESGGNLTGNVTNFGGDTAYKYSGVNTSLFMSIADIHKFLKNISIKARLFSEVTGGSVGNVESGLYVLDSELYKQTNSNIENDTSLWECVYNLTSKKVDCYNDGAFNKSLTILGNQSRIYSTIPAGGSGAKFGNWSMEYFNYSLRKSVYTNLTSPADNVDLVSLNQNNFTVNLTTPSIVGQNYSLINATLIIWNSLGTEVYRNYTNLTGNLNSTIFVNVSVPVGTSYQWNVYSCEDNGCFFSDANSSFDLNSYIVNDVDYTNITTEKNIETFVLDFNITSGTQVSTAKFIYNNTIYSSTLNIANAPRYTVSSTIAVDSVTTDSNISFYWNITQSNGFSFVTSKYNQTVNNLAMDNCSDNSVLLLNYTLFDEVGLYEINATKENATIEVDVALYSTVSSLQVINYSHSYYNLSNARVCIGQDLANSEYILEATARYSATQYATEYHNIQNYSLSNSTTSMPIHISLYDLLSANAQAFNIYYRDSYLIPVKDAIIDIQRYYVGEGRYRSVEVPKTDSDGKVVASLVLNDVVYTFIVRKNGIVLDTFNNVVVTCDNAAYEECRVNLNSLSSPLTTHDFTNAGGLSYTLDYDTTTRQVQSIFSTSDGGSSTVLLNVTLSDNYGKTEVCSDSLVSSSGILTCTVPSSYENVTLIASIYRDGSLAGRKYFSLKLSAESIYSGIRMILILIAMTMLPLMAIGNVVATFFIIFIGIWLLAAVNLMEGSKILGSSATILWGIIAAGIILWKISRTK